MQNLPEPPEGGVPLPALGTDADAGERQPWNPEIEEQTYFTVRFQPTLKEHWRCHSRILCVRPGYTLYWMGFAVFLGFFLPLGRYTSKIIHAGLSGKVGKQMLFEMAISALSYLIAYWIMTPLIHIGSSIKRVGEIRKAKPVPNELTVTSTYIACDTFPKPTKLLWKEVSAVILNRGDLYVLGIQIDRGFYVPHHAFSDTVSTKLLYDAIHSLWKNNGHPDAFLPDARKRFSSGETENAL